MTDSAFIQDWPESKLTVAQLRAVLAVLREHEAEYPAVRFRPDYTDAVRKLDAALDAALMRAEGREKVWVVKHTRNGYLKRRGRSDEPSLEWVDDPQKAMHMSQESAEFIVDREVNGQHQAPDPTAAERWSVEEIEVTS